jgi:hypothetical protein
LSRRWNCRSLLASSLFRIPTAQDFFNFVEKVGGFFSSSDSENTYYVLPSRHSILSAPSTVFRFPYSMCGLRSQPTRALHTHLSLHQHSWYVRCNIAAPHADLSFSNCFIDCAYQRHPCEQRYCRRKEDPSRHVPFPPFR